MNYGYQNEYDFVELFNNKYLNDLDNSSQHFLTDVFDGLIANDEKIKCWKNKANQKTDIFIKYKNYIKNISLKCGNGNSIHHEQIQEFKRYLSNIGIPYKVIDYYISYHYGYIKDKDGKTNYSKRLNSEEYKQYYQNELDIFNKYINKTRIIIGLIDRFIIRGNNSDYDIDALVSGTVNNYTWILKYDLYDLILSKRCTYFTSPHFACITLGPQKRNPGDANHRSDKYMVCGRWNFLHEDIIEFKKNNFL